MLLPQSLEIPISQIECNDFCERRRSNVEDLINSFERQGQLSPICVRRHPAKHGRYQIVYGNRRLAADQKLGWKKISASIVDAKDSSAILMAFAENVDRTDFTDYEKATVLKRLHEITGYNYNQIASSIGKSPAYVSQHVAMLNIFPENVGSARERETILNELTESHCRILARIPDPKERWSTAKLVVHSHLGIRELQRFCSATGKREISQSSTVSRKSGEDSKEREWDTVELRKVVTDIITGLNSRDIRPFVKSIDTKHFFMFPGFSMTTVIGPDTLSDYLSEILRHATKFKLLSPRYVDVRFTGSLAYVAVVLREEVTASFTTAETIARVTFIFEKLEEGVWKMVHAHWSLASPLDVRYKPDVVLKEGLH
jgi:ParB family chromosome partitioning protein